jgi:uncharacterized membrane protein YhiD involved in acid resistance
MDRLIELLYINLTDVTVIDAALNLLVAFACTLVVMAVYFFTSKDVRPTMNFVKTLLITSLSTCLVIMLIGANLALSLGMVGALSVIRFRAAVKDSRDAAFIFYVIAVGMTCALGVYALAAVGTLFIGVAVLLFSFLNVGATTYVLTVVSAAYNTDAEGIIKKAAGRRYRAVALSLREDEGGSGSVEIVYELGLKRGAAELCAKLLQTDGVKSVNAVLREDI